MNNKSMILGMVLGIVLTFAVAPIVIKTTESAIPPTKAFMSIGSNDTDITTAAGWTNATKYNDVLWIVSDGSILIEMVQYEEGLE